MRIIADLHIHSPYARAVSKEMTLENLDAWARLKGITVMGTGDFTHPKWMKEIKEKLEPAEPGLYKLKAAPSLASTSGEATLGAVRFILTVEISSIYKKGGKVRRIHTLIFAPSIETAENINAQLGWRGNLKSDGRPILGLDAHELAKIVFNIDPDAVIVPAHCLLPKTLIHLQDGIRPIDTVCRGDRVITHRGRARRVTAVYRRLFRGSVYRVQPWYFSLGLTTTPEHPYYVLTSFPKCPWKGGLCKPTPLHAAKCPYRGFENVKPRWVPAERLRRGDVLVYPRLRGVLDVPFIDLHDAVSGLRNIPPHRTYALHNTAVALPGTRSTPIPGLISVSKDFCRLIGYYLAEGSENSRDAISFTFHRGEHEYINDVERLMAQCFNVRPTMRVREDSCEMIFYSKTVQQFFAYLCYGTGSRHRADTKALPAWMLRLPYAKQAEILRGWWRGDKGYTSSRLLMNQMKLICLRLGIIPSIYAETVERYTARGHHMFGQRVIRASSDSFKFQLSFFEDFFKLLADAAFQRSRSQLVRRHGWMDEENAYLPIRSVRTEHYRGTVYNLEVEEDNSYLAEFAAVHNCWTPWFSIFGSMSGFDSIEECFEEFTPQIFAIETGLSSDPAMNWRLSKLDAVALISNSDSHSLQRIGREANIFDTELSYSGIMAAIRSHDPARFLFTVEFFPEEGKYHYDGHSEHKIRLSPAETRKLGGKCPTCGRPVTVGVLNRVEALADRPAGAKPPNAVPFKSMIPLDEIIAEAFDMGVSAKKVKEAYQRLVAEIGSEFRVLLEAPASDLKSATVPEVAEGILRVRSGRVKIEPGYDGEYGRIKIFDEGDRKNFAAGQTALFG